MDVLQEGLRERHIKEADKAYYVGQIPVYTTSEIKRSISIS
jgi:hypothetical protein